MSLCHGRVTLEENHSNNIGSSLCLSIVMAESFDAVGCNYEEAVEPNKTHLVVPQEEEDEEDDENEDYECEEEEEYSFRFKEGESPMEFVEDNTLSGQPYKQFERLKYEALAQRKRKAASNNTLSEGLAKKARVEEGFSATMEELMKCMNYGARRKSREMLFGVLEEKNATPHFHLVVEVADTLMDLGHYDFALKYIIKCWKEYLVVTNFAGCSSWPSCCSVYSWAELAREPIFADCSAILVRCSGGKKNALQWTY